MNNKIIFSLEHNHKAQEDAERALELNGKNIKAILAKAESLYNSGHFELGSYL